MKKIFPMTLQLFAEGDGDGAGGGNVSGAGASGEGTNNEPLSFDGFLAQEGNQAEFDRRVQKAIDTAVSNAQQKWQALTDDKLSEAERLAKMNKEEKAAFMQQKKEKELSDRESAVARKELMAEAKNTLAEKKLPAGLAEVLNYTNAESCNKSIDAVEKAFQAAVEAAVQERLKGGEPPKTPPNTGDDMAKQVEALMMGRI